LLVVLMNNYYIPREVRDFSGKFTQLQSLLEHRILSPNNSSILRSSPQFSAVLRSFATHSKKRC